MDTDHPSQRLYKRRLATMRANTNRNTSYRVIMSAREIATLKSGRNPDAFHVPESWRDRRFSSLSRLSPHTVRDDVNARGLATFGARPVMINVSSTIYAVPSFGLDGNCLPVNVDGLGLSQNCITFNNVQIVEHALALAGAMGIVGSYSLDRRSFPSFADGLGPFLEQMVGNLVPVPERIRAVTVREPFAMLFERGQYIIVEPDEGAHALVMDHQVDHPHNVLQRTRIITPMEPDVFAYIARARAMSFGVRTKFLKFWFRRWFGLWMPKRLPGLGLGPDQITIVDRDRVLNGRSEYEARGRNVEAVVHELIDKAAIPGPTPGFVGTLTTFRTTHRHDVTFMDVLADRLT